MSQTIKSEKKIFRPVYNVFYAPAREGYRNKYEAKNILQITTQKSLSSPCGTFEIVMNYDPNNVASGSAPVEGTSRVEGGSQNRWSDILAPNDYIEIWLGRIDSHPSQVVMRGWIDNVSVSEQAGTSGPILRITINGRDYGKLWLVARILNIDPRAATSIINLAQQYHITLFNSNLPKLFHETMDKIVQPYITYHQGVNSAVSSFAVESKTIDPDTDPLFIFEVSTAYVMEVAYSLLSYYTTAPLLELFIRDDDDMPRFVLRWAPVRSSDNKQMTGMLDPYPDTIISHQINPVDDIVENNLTRSDTDTFNWIRAVSEGLSSTEGEDLSFFIVPKKMPYVIGQSIDMYGLRPMIIRFPYYDLKQGDLRPAIQEGLSGVQDEEVRFTLWCANMYGHDYALINGSVRVKGIPVYKIGEELIVNDQYGQPKDIFYIEGVQHEFIYNQSYRTLLNLTRGMPVGGFKNGGLDSMSPFSLPTSFPSDIDPALIAQMNLDLMGGTIDLPNPGPH